MQLFEKFQKLLRPYLHVNVKNLGWGRKRLMLLFSVQEIYGYIYRLN